MDLVSTDWQVSDPFLPFSSQTTWVSSTYQAPSIKRQGEHRDNMIIRERRERRLVPCRSWYLIYGISAADFGDRFCLAVRRRNRRGGRCELSWAEVRECIRVDR